MKLCCTRWFYAPVVLAAAMLLASGCDQASLMAVTSDGKTEVVRLVHSRMPSDSALPHPAEVDLRVAEKIGEQSPYGCYMARRAPAKGKPQWDYHSIYLHFSHVFAEKAHHEIEKRAFFYGGPDGTGGRINVALANCTFPRVEGAREIIKKFLGTTLLIARGLIAREGDQVAGSNRWIRPDSTQATG